MLKLIFTGKKPPGQSMEEFRRYYLDHHAPLFMRTVPAVRKYTINFAVERPGKENPFDFITEIWWDDFDAGAPILQVGRILEHHSAGRSEARRDCAGIVFRGVRPEVMTPAAMNTRD